MSVTLKIDNFSSNNLGEQTVLDAVVNVGDTTITLRSNQGYLANDFFIISTPGSEATDLLKITALVGKTQFTLASPAQYLHQRFDPVVKIFGDKIKIYTATNVNGYQPADTSFTALAGAVFAIDPDQLSTSFTDLNGDSTVWYKYTYINSLSLVETALADTGASRGNGLNYCSTDLVRNKASLQNNRWISDGQVADARKTAQSEVDSTLVGAYTVPFTTPINDLIKDTTALLAAGILLTSAYGQNSTGTVKDGQQKMKDARTILQRILDKELILTDITGLQTNTGNANTIQSWPDNTTAGLEEKQSGGDHLFRINHIY